MSNRGVPYHRVSNGRFAETPKRYMPIPDALNLMGNPPKTWTPYKEAHSWPARSLYEQGLALLAQRRENGKMVGIWKQAKGSRK